MQNPLQESSGEPNMMYDGFMSYPMTSTAAYGPLPVPQQFYPQYSEFQAKNQFDKTGLSKKQREENNMRERKRVKKINIAFECLSEKVRPYTSGNKMTKLQVLQEAIKLIDRLNSELCSVQNNGTYDRTLSRMRSDTSRTTVTTQYSSQSL